MRLWSLHPVLLDKAGIGGLWREGLLAQKVLAGKTKGYKYHSQLDRFKKFEDPQKAINDFLFYVWDNAFYKRNYKYNFSKIQNPF